MSKHRASRSAGRYLVVSLVAAVMLIGAVTVMVWPSDSPEAGANVAVATAPEVVATPSPLPSVAPVELQADAVDAVAEIDPAPPQKSGEGRRIVFDQGDQRVWLIDDDEAVVRTYLVSGSRFENLSPGAYSVTSKTRHATAFDASGTMEYFVRFATGFSEPIGFHSVPHDNSGKLEQTKAQLGQRLSAGCVRQWKNDAIALWEFAPIGTKVHVTA